MVGEKVIEDHNDGVVVAVVDLQHRKIGRKRGVEFVKAAWQRGAIEDVMKSQIM